MTGTSNLCSCYICKMLLPIPVDLYLSIMSRSHVMCDIVSDICKRCHVSLAFIFYVVFCLDVSFYTIFMYVLCPCSVFDVDDEMIPWQRRNGFTFLGTTELVNICSFRLYLHRHSKPTK